MAPHRTRRSAPSRRSSLVLPTTKPQPARKPHNGRAVCAVDVRAAGLGVERCELRRTTSHCSKRRTGDRELTKSPRLPQRPRVRSPRTRPRRSSSRGRSRPRARCRAAGKPATRRCDQGRHHPRPVATRRSWPIIERALLGLLRRAFFDEPSSTMSSSTMSSSSTLPPARRLPIADGDRLFALFTFLRIFRYEAFRSCVRAWPF